MVEVRAPDQPGLAYTLAHTLSGLGLDLRFARIATEKALALDVFYVTDAEGGSSPRRSRRRWRRLCSHALGQTKGTDPNHGAEEA